MSINIRIPNITGTTSDQRVAQIEGYLSVLARELNLALSEIENGSAAVETRSQQGLTSVTEQQAEKLFSALKPLIIKNADIISSYSESIVEKLSGEYVAQSEFGDYIKETEATYVKNDENYKQQYERIEKIGDAFGSSAESAIVKASKATITTGYLGDDENGNAIYGMEVLARYNEESGEVIASARFTSDGVVINDENGIPSLIITDKTVNAEKINVSGIANICGMQFIKQGNIITGNFVG